MSSGVNGTLGKNEDYLKICFKGDLKQAKEKFKVLNREQIESIRDKHKAR